MEQNLAFTSQNCMFCKKVFETINKKGLSDQYQFIQLEDGYKFPDFVNMVPTVLLKDGSIIEGQKVFDYLEQITEKIDTTQNIETYQANENGNSWSDNYSFIGGDSNGTNGQAIKHSFSFIGEEQQQQQSFDQLTGLSDSGGKGNRGAGIDMDSLVQQRQKQLEDIIPMVKRV